MMKRLLLLVFTVGTVIAIPRPIREKQQPDKRELFDQLLNLLERRFLDKKDEAPLQLNERWMSGCMKHDDYERPFMYSGMPVFTEPTGVITSPGWTRGEYPNNIACEWKIQAPTGQRVEVTVHKLDVPGYWIMSDGVSICADELTFYDNDFNTIHSYCSIAEAKSLPTVTSEDDQVLVYFCTDPIEAWGGFKLSWKFV